MDSTKKTTRRVHIHIPPYLLTVLLGTGALLLVAALISSPEEAFKASIQGLDIWWKMVFPALLPFLMLSQMLTAYGFTSGLGVLIEPMMKKWFNMPGPSGIGLAVGMSAGFPSGADTAVQLYRQNMITSKEAARLAALTHFVNPMTLLIVMGTAFFQNPIIGYVLIFIHWTAGLISGCILARFASKNEPSLAAPSSHSKKTGTAHKNLFHTMLETASATREKDGRSFGKLLGDTVSHAVQVLMMTGGSMIVFSVLAALLGKYITPFVPGYFWSSFFEIHLGAYEFRNTNLILHPLYFGLLAAAISWGGLSSHFQVSALLRPYGISTAIFTIGRLLHAGISYLLVLILWTPIKIWITSSQTVFQAMEIGPHTSASPEFLGFGVKTAGWLGLLLILLIMIFIGLSVWITRWRVARGSSSH